MKKIWVFIFLISTIFIFSASQKNKNQYQNLYLINLEILKNDFENILKSIEQKEDKKSILNKIHYSRKNLKKNDFFLRYYFPILYRKINAAQEIEYEVEVFEKWEKPYKRIGAGLSLMEIHLEENKIDFEKLKNLAIPFLEKNQLFKSDSILNEIQKPKYFYFANRLFLLNLATIYTTGFENPNKESVIKELKILLKNTENIYSAFENDYPNYPLSNEYKKIYQSLISWLEKNNFTFEEFNHYYFIKNFVNLLFKINQSLIQKYNLQSNSFVDYSLNNKANSIFDKSLFQAQKTKGIFEGIEDSLFLQELKSIGKKLFYDPILSGNNKRACASCHEPKSFFTDNKTSTAIHFNQKEKLPRNTPSLINSQFNHLLHIDGQHLDPLSQAFGVLHSTKEMNSDEKNILKKVLSCKEYKHFFNESLTKTKANKKVTLEHITSAMVFYYSSFNDYYSSFDKSLNNKNTLINNEIFGFNLFMGKAECGTCHFPPFFNSIKPPYTNSEFEIIGVPADSNYKNLSSDLGRYHFHKVKEMKNAFRTPILKNIEKTAPFMHNGVFHSLEQCLEFYNNAGGIGHNLILENQTLSIDSLKLTPEEEFSIIQFLKSLTEEIEFENPPKKLPKSTNKSLNSRKIGGEY